MLPSRVNDKQKQATKPIGLVLFSEKNISLLLLAFFSLLLVYLFNDKKDSGESTFSSYSQEPTTKSVTDQKVLKQINDYLQDLVAEEGVRALNAEMENKELAPAISPYNSLPTSEMPDDRTYGVDLRDDNVSEKLYADLYGKDSAPRVATPEEKINSRIAKRQWLGDYERLTQERYIKEFVSNAKAAGYNVLINDKFEVIEVQYVGRIENPLRLPQSLEKLGVPVRGSQGSE